MTLARNETRIERNETRLARNETRGGNLHLGGTVMKWLAFGDVDECSFKAEADLGQNIEETNYGNGLSDLVKQLEFGTSNKDVRLTHLKVCSLRNKIK